MNKLFIGLISIIVTTSCVSSVNSLQPEVVSRSDAQKQQYVVFGTIKDTNRVTIEDDREVGAIAGAAIGGKIMTLFMPVGYSRIKQVAER